MLAYKHNDACRQGSCVGLQVALVARVAVSLGDQSQTTVPTPHRSVDRILHSCLDVIFTRALRGCINQTPEGFSYSVRESLRLP